MAFVNTDIELGGTTMAQSTGMPGTADDQNMQLNSHNVERGLCEFILVTILLNMLLFYTISMLILNH